MKCNTGFLRVWSRAPSDVREGCGRRSDRLEENVSNYNRVLELNLSRVQHLGPWAYPRCCEAILPRVPYDAFVLVFTSSTHPPFRSHQKRPVSTLRTSVSLFHPSPWILTSRLVHLVPTRSLQSTLSSLVHPSCNNPRHRPPSMILRPLLVSPHHPKRKHPNRNLNLLSFPLSIPNGLHLIAQPNHHSSHRSTAHRPDLRSFNPATRHRLITYRKSPRDRATTRRCLNTPYPNLINPNSRAN